MKLTPQMAATITASAKSSADKPRGGNMPPDSRGARAIMQ
jgi:hypothetical protein